MPRGFKGGPGGDTLGGVNPFVETLSPGRTEELREFLLNLPDLNRNLALATSNWRRTTVRMVSVLLFGGRIYFQTHATSTKARQIRWNSRVALSGGPLTLEGRARSLGHPLDPVHGDISDAYRKAHPGSFAHFSRRPEQRLFEVTPLRYLYWRREGSTPFNEVWVPGLPGPGRGYRDYYLGRIDETR
jgi:hypothetical protein